MRAGVFPANPRFVQVDIDDRRRACALDDAGKIMCWGAGSRWIYTEPLEPATEIVLNEETLCARQLDDTVKCTGPNASYAHVTPEVPLRHIAYSDARCLYGLDYEGTLHAWGGSNPDTDCEHFGGQFQTFEYYGSHQTACGLQTDGVLACWKRQDDVWLRHELPGPWTDFLFVADTACVVGADSGLSCFLFDGEVGFSPSPLAPPPGRVDRLVGGGPFAVVTEGARRPQLFYPRGATSANNGFGAVYFTPWERAGAQLMSQGKTFWSGTSRMCLLGADSRIRCNHRRAMIDAPGAIDIVDAGSVVCYRDQRSMRYCVDFSDDEPAYLPGARTGPMVGASSGVCGVDDQGYLDCVSFLPSASFAHAPTRPGPGILRGGWRGWCFKPDNEVGFCFTARDKVWTPLDSNLRFIDPGQTGPRDVDDGGNWLVCGISQDDELVCASSRDYIRLPSPNPQDPFVDVQVEGMHACARRRSGSFACFGRYEYFEDWDVRWAIEESRALPALESGQQLHVGVDNTCLFTPGASMTCWGKEAF